MKQINRKEFDTYIISAVARLSKEITSPVTVYCGNTTDERVVAYAFVAEAIRQGIYATVVPDMAEAQIFVLPSEEHRRHFEPPDGLGLVIVVYPHPLEDGEVLAWPWEDDRTTGGALQTVRVLLQQCGWASVPDDDVIAGIARVYRHFAQPCDVYEPGAMNSQKMSTLSETVSVLEPVRVPVRDEGSLFPAFAEVRIAMRYGSGGCLYRRSIVRIVRYYAARCMAAELAYNICNDINKTGCVNLLCVVCSVDRLCTEDLSISTTRYVEVRGEETGILAEIARDLVRAGKN